MTKTTKFLLSAAVAALFFIASCGKTTTPNANAKFVGSYAVADTGVATGSHAGTSYYTYTMSIAANATDPSGNAISITNFGGFVSGSVVSGTVNGSSFTVPTTNIGNVTISNASGSINGNVLSFTYSATDTTGVSIDHAVGSK